MTLNAINIAMSPISPALFNDKLESIVVEANSIKMSLRRYSSDLSVEIRSGTCLRTSVRTIRVHYTFTKAQEQKAGLFKLII
jgi:hypothetical protein